MKLKLPLLLLLVALPVSAYLLYPRYQDNLDRIQRSDTVRSVFHEINKVTSSVKPEPNFDDLPTEKIIPGGTHVFQTFNNCGPASLSMTLSLYGITISQAELGNELRPYQNQAGDNDDKSVTLAEVAEKSKDFGFTPYHRPNGNMDIIRAFIANDMPVITRTWLKPNEDIGHFRVVKGYNNTAREIFQNDSFDGKDLWFSYDEFNVIWKKFNYEYLVLVPNDKIEVAEGILGEDLDVRTAWEKAVDLSRNQLEKTPNDIYARFNLSVALYNVGDFEGSVMEFEKVESQLPFRTLWYQIEPILAYFELGDYDRVFEISDRILTTGNRAFSELYYLKGQIYLERGQTDLAREEFEKAVLYNENYEPAIEALEAL